MKDYFLKVIKKEIPETLRDSGKIRIASSLSDAVKAFVEWKDKRCIYRPMTNTYNVVTEGLIQTLDELFVFFIAKIYKK